MENQRQLYRFIGPNEEYAHGELLWVEYADGTDLWEYTNGEDVNYLYNPNSIYAEVEHYVSPQPQDFGVGTKWVATCSVTTMEGDHGSSYIIKGARVLVSDRSANGNVEFDNTHWVFGKEASLLFEPYIDVRKKMTREDIEQTLGYEIEIVE